MISGASEEELIEAIGRTDVLLEFMPKIKQLQQENQQLKEELKYTIGIVEHNRIISKKNKEIHQLKKQIEEYQKALDETMSEKMDIENNWNKLKEIARSQSGFKKIAGLKGGAWFEIDELLDKMQELEQGSDSK